jgi:hypothetical protein
VNRETLEVVVGVVLLCFLLVFVVVCCVVFGFAALLNLLAPAILVSAPFPQAY